MKNIYMAATAEENGKCYAYMIKASEGDNILAVLERHKDLIFANIMPREKAKETVEFWNDCYRNNGTYMFADGPFE